MNMVDNNEQIDTDHIDFSDFRRDGQGQLSPVIASDKELYEEALIVADLIEQTGRRTLKFSEFMEDRPKFIPDCARDDVAMDILEDSESNADHVGGMKQEEVVRVLDAKEHCAMCPIQKGCLAVSMTQPQTSANRRTEPRLPKKPDDTSSVNLVMSEYLLFGGYTPQERKIIFSHIQDILSFNDQYEKTLWENTKKTNRSA